MTDFQVARDSEKQAKINLENAMRSGNSDAVKQAQAELRGAQEIIENLQGGAAVTDHANVGETARQLMNAGKDKAFKMDKNFYKGFMSGVFGNENDAKATKAKTMSENYRQSSAEHGAEAKQHQQIANRNEFSEAGKIASVQNDAENRQTINNTSYAAGNAAALQRKTNTPDVQGQREYQSQQRSQAEQQREKEQNDRQAAGMTKADEQQLRIASRDYNYDARQTDELSEGKDPSQDTQKPGAKPTKKPEQPPQTTTQTTGESWKANAQQAINYMTYGDTEYPNGQTILKTLYNNNLISVNPEDVKPVNGTSNDAFQVYAQQYPNSNEAKLYQELLNLAKRVSDNGSQINVGDNGLTTQQLYDQSQYSGDTPSDTRLKDIIAEVSDMRCKNIINALNNSEDLHPYEVQFLMEQCAKGFGKDVNEDSDESVLNDYAKYIKNYLYTYKDEARRIDPSIDPNQEHIGPMAQDIEKVNPACINETQDGTKTVDTGRLALMNAGAIADLARELKELKEVLNG